MRVGVTDTRVHKIDPEKDMNQRISMIPLGRMATPDEIANVVYWLGSDLNTFTTGQVITTAGGEKKIDLTISFTTFYLGKTETLFSTTTKATPYHIPNQLQPESL